MYIAVNSISINPSLLCCTYEVIKLKTKFYKRLNNINNKYIFQAY
jgi:hypothetical protein